VDDEQAPAVGRQAERAVRFVVGARRQVETRHLPFCATKEITAAVDIARKDHHAAVG
jgi:hypothetical protein